MFASNGKNLNQFPNRCSALKFSLKRKMKKKKMLLSNLFPGDSKQNLGEDARFRSGGDEKRETSQ
jgi:hypothetical protein